MCTAIKESTPQTQEAALNKTIIVYKWEWKWKRWYSRGRCVLFQIRLSLKIIQYKSIFKAIIKLKRFYYSVNFFVELNWNIKKWMLLVFNKTMMIAATINSTIIIIIIILIIISIQKLERKMLNGVVLSDSNLNLFI